MQEPRRISPLLDNFDVGDPIKESNGVRCCPAMRKNSDSKYIVKIISTPASQTQLDALLLTGAYSSADEALTYFKSLAENIIDEAKTLQKLSQLEGFLPVTDWQMVAMEQDVGYDVYLLSEYRNTLAQQYRHGIMTHLGALNLGLDLCSALAVCRRMGYLYVDLKPENIYFTSDNACRIGDIGFMRLDSLKYASLPERYRSAYTAPEIADAFSSVNATVDIYALGLILYQAFNNGQLPAISSIDNNGVFPAPDYADYEMAEIILKACHPNPEMRWQDPIEIGQALVSYMQRNGAHDTPIVPQIEIPQDAEDVAVEDPSDPELFVEETQALSDTENQQRDVTLETNEPDSQEDSETTTLQYEENPDGSLSFSLSPEYDETAPEQMDEEVHYDEVSTEVSDMLSQADELISHPTPDPVIPPAPIDVPIPAPIETAEESDEIIDDSEVSSDLDSQETVEEEIIPDELDIGEEVEAYDDAYEDNYIDCPTSKRKKRWIPIVIITVACVLLAAFAFFFYTNYYLQKIDAISLKMKDNGDITVIVTSQTDETKLSVICSDIYGNQLTQPVKDGTASFTKLTPGSSYTIQIVIDGFHQLTGTTSASFNTPAQTNILQLQATTGNEDGSVVISFSIDGPDSKKWQLQYTSQDGHEQSVSFAGHMYSITGLPIDTAYTFTLTPETNINYTGTNTVTHTVSKVVVAENLQVMGWVDGALTAKWQVPENAAVNSWSVRCYNDNGYDQTLVVTEPAVSFSGTDNSNAYTLEVVAGGQSASVRADIPANSYTVFNFNVDSSASNKLKVSWNDNGIKPADGWYLIYSIDNSELQKVQVSADNAVEIDNPIPDAKYIFSLQTAEGALVLGGQLNYETQKATAFSGYGVTANMMDFKMCKTPSKKDWSRTDLKETDYTTTFKPGSKASFLVHLKHSYKVSDDKITTLFVIRDENGTVISAASTTKAWRKMWYRSYCELDIPSIPDVAGNYNISIYFNGALAHHESFTIK